ncbi:MAG: hypothetical protein EOO77_17380 [Oxalobacteraceae bacterium]|nr:MAG: hypothetical protein EOO77_17380 [Oxalobacteraceae bacterium]
MTLSANCLLPMMVALTACGQSDGSKIANADVPVARSSLTVSLESAARPLAAVPVSSTAVSEFPSEDPALAKQHASIIDELRRLLVGKAMFDALSITDVRTLDACRTAITTARGATTIEWSRAGNIAPRDVAGREINDLPTASGPKPLSVPVGEMADGVSGAVGMLVENCTR